MTPECEAFRTICRSGGVSPTDAQFTSIESFAALLLEWNAKINLISRKDTANLWNRHIVGSVSFLFNYGLPPDARIADIGTGGGLPGIPLAILFPQSRFTLIDSIQKKITAVTDMIDRLGLENATAVCGRVEELALKKEYKASYDYVISRAVAPVFDILKWSRDLLSDEYIEDEPLGKNVIRPGAIVMLKGGDISSELASAKVKFPKIKLELHDLPAIPTVPELEDKKIVIAR